MTIYATFDATALFAGEKQPVQRPVTLAAGQNAAPINGFITPLKRGTLLGRSAVGEASSVPKTAAAIPATAP